MKTGSNKSLNSFNRLCVSKGTHNCFHEALFAKKSLMKTVSKCLMKRVSIFFQKKSLDITESPSGSEIVAPNIIYIYMYLYCGN